LDFVEEKEGRLTATGRLVEVQLQDVFLKPLDHPQDRFLLGV
jgi:hypothetical protein